MSELKGRVQDYLDRRNETYLAGDFPGMRDMVVLPTIVVTRTAVIIVETEEMLREGFDAWRNMLETQQVTDTVHSVTGTTEVSDDLISARWKTHLLRGANPICPPYKSSGTFRIVDGKLRGVSMTLGMKNLSWPITVPRVDGDGETLE